VSPTGFDPRPLKVAVAGAGASGLCIAYKILDGMKKGTLKSIDFTVYEKLDGESIYLRCSRMFTTDFCQKIIQELGQHFRSSRAFSKLNVFHVLGMPIDTLDVDVSLLDTSYLCAPTKERM